MQQDKRWETTLPDRPFDQFRVIKLAASAGCGKTFVIERTINDLLARGTPPDAIMYVVFNKKPAVEFRSKFLHLTKDETRWWETHHSINLRLIKNNPLFKSIEVMGDRGKHWDAFTEQYGYEFGEDEDGEEAEGRRLRNLVSSKLYRNVAVEDMEEDECLFYERLCSYEAKNKALSFISMMMLSLSMDMFPAGVEYVFVDEAQDNGPVQNNYWIRMLEQHPEIKGFVLAGDDKQAINRFKGGDAEGFLSFPSDLNVSLGASYRCPLPVLNLANSIAGPITRRSPLVFESKAEASGSVSYAPQFHMTIDEIKENIRDRKTTLILSRTKRVAGAARGRYASTGLPLQSEIADRIRRVYRSFIDMKASGQITLQDFDILNPNRSPSVRPVDGELKISCSYIDQAARKQEIKKMRESELSASQQSFLEQADENSAFPIPLHEAESVGLTTELIRDVLSGDGPNPAYFYGGEKAAKMAEAVALWVDAFGPDYVPAQITHIHKIKGSEARLVVLLTDIGKKMIKVEREEEDDERRVWYTGVTRSLDRVIVTKLNRDSDVTRFL